MRRVIKFHNGEKAVVYKHTDVRRRLTHKQYQDIIMADLVVNIPETKELLWFRR